MLPITDLDSYLDTLAESDFLVIGAGVIHVRKGVDVFLRTAGIVRDLGDSGRKIKFAWIGERDDPFGWYEMDLLTLIQHQNLEKTVTFLEPSPDLEKLYSRANLLYISSRRDPFPNVAIDAVVAGVPVLGFEGATGFANWVSQSAGLPRFALPYLDAEAAAKEIVKLANGTDYPQLSQQIELAAAETFDMRRYVEAIDKIGVTAKFHREVRAKDIEAIAKDEDLKLDTHFDVVPDKPHRDLAETYLLTSGIYRPWTHPFSGQYRRPIPGFNPLAYSEQNPDYDPESGSDPLVDYLDRGRPTGPWSYELIGPPAPGQTPEPSAFRVLFHIHLHYPSLLPDFLDDLQVNQTKVTLELTTTSDDKAAELEQLLRGYSVDNVRVSVVPNVGRDFGSLLTGLHHDIADFDIIGHAHGKKSPHTTSSFASRWNRALQEQLIGGKYPMLDQILAAFANDSALGLVFPEDPHINDWDQNRDIAERLAIRLGINKALPAKFDFPIGNFWLARREAIQPLFDARFAWEEYPPEPIGIDGTMLHALERLLPFVAQSQGYHFAKTYIAEFAR